MTPVVIDSTPRQDRQRGTTLTGLMVGMAVGILVLTATLNTYLMISEGARDNLLQARLNQELRAALDLMQLDIRRAGYWDFNDTDGQGDANGDGVFDWRDLGVGKDGAGTFDTDADGDSDAHDLRPINNPFQRRYGIINNDLCIDTSAATGDCAQPTCTALHASGRCLTFVQTGSCLTYSYDLDADARVGIRACQPSDDEDDCPEPTGPFGAENNEPYTWRTWYPPEQEDKTRSIEMEMFGFRHNKDKGNIEMRAGRYGKEDIRFGCDIKIRDDDTKNWERVGHWEGITSPDILITDLEFKLTTQTRNTNPGKSQADPCESGDICQAIRSVEIRLSGRLVADADSEQSLSTIVAIRNDRYWEKTEESP